MESASRQKWSLTQEAFDAFLDALDPDRGDAGNRYLEVRANLVRLFEWRGCPLPDDYADEVINRCAKKISEGDAIRDIPTYCVGIARMLLKEMARAPDNKVTSLHHAPEPRALPADPVMESDEREACLRRCLNDFSPENRDLILRYYQGEKGEKINNRKGLERLFGVPAGTLRMRALRLREKLQSCTERCLQKKGVLTL
ncbi:MAG: hypothetical protein HY820_37735 [Acidobacteria bacterium]|nr:hypothetical protein [Acidobacteriota bacterium]